MLIYSLNHRRSTKLKSRPSKWVRLNFEAIFIMGIASYVGDNVSFPRYIYIPGRYRLLFDITSCLKIQYQQLLVKY